MLSFPSWMRGRSGARAAVGTTRERSGGGSRRDGDTRSVQERNLSSLLFVAATNNTAWNLITPFIPLFILELVDGDPIQAAAWSGIALGISPLMTALAGPFWGNFAARYGARRAMMRTLLTSPVLVVLLAFCTAIWQLLLLRFLIGVAGGFYVLVHALVAQTAARDRVGHAIGSLQAISMLSLAIVPPIAGLFTDIWGVRSNFFLGAAIMLASFAVMWRGYQSETPTAADGAGGTSSPGTAESRVPKERAVSYWSLIRSPELALIAAIVFVGQYVERTFWPLAPLLVVEMAPGSEQIGSMTGFLLGIGSGATALSALVVGRLTRRVSVRSLLIASLAFGCVTLPLVAVMDSFWTFVGVRVVMGLLTGGVVTLAYAYVSTILPADRLSVSFSMFASVAMVASAVGPVSMSTLATTAGLRSPLIVGAIGFGCCLVLLLLAGRRSETSRAVPQQAERSEGGA